MDFGKAAELMKFNAILPEALSESISVEFSKEDLLKLQEVPIKELDLLADDPYQKIIGKFAQVSKIKIRDSYILFPMPDKMRLGNKIVPLNVFQIIQYFGFAPNQLRKLFFINNSIKREGSLLAAEMWKKWFFNEKSVSDHPIYRSQRPGWLLIRKSLIPDSAGKNLKDGNWKLKYNDRVPMLLEVLVGMIGFYFLIKDSKKKDSEIGVPFYMERDWFARILSGSMAWTSDQCSLKENSPAENLTVGFNTPDSGIDIEKLDSCKSSEVVGILPVRRLDN